MSNGKEYMFTLANKNNNDKLFKLLGKDKTNINKLNKEGYSLLHIAIIKRNISMLNKLLQLKANPNIKTTNKKQTPLHFAYIYGKDKSKEIIKVLKSFKADENILDIYNKKPLDYLNNKFFEQKKEKSNNNNIHKTFKKINNKILGDIDICESNGNEDYSSLEDSLEQPIKKIEISEIYNKSRNNINLKTENKTPIFRYPNLFNNIINNNLNNTCNKINKTETQIFKEILTKKRSTLNIRNSNLKINRNYSTGFISADSTEERTKSKNNKERITMITNKDVVEFNYEDSNSNIENNIITHNINNINTINNSMTNNYNNNTSFNVLNKETITENILFTKKYSNKPTININVNIELKYWLDNLNLSEYLDNFIQNDIFDINILINQMNNPEQKLNYDSIESLLKIHKPGHIYRIFSALEISAGIINSKIGDFLMKKNSRNNLNKSKNNLKLSVSREINSSCVNCFRINFLFSQKKNDLNSFLSRYNLLKFYQNFYHNGFEIINYVMAQMYSSDPIDEFILENCFHIYEKQDREKVLKCLLNEKNKINYFLDSKEYLQFNSKHNIKYEDIIFEKKENNNDINNSQNERIIIPNNSSCIDCIIF